MFSSFAHNPNASCHRSDLLIFGRCQVEKGMRHIHRTLEVSGGQMVHWYPIMLSVRALYLIWFA